MLLWQGSQRCHCHTVSLSLPRTCCANVSMLSAAATVAAPALDLAAVITGGFPNNDTFYDFYDIAAGVINKPKKSYCQTISWQSSLHWFSDLVSSHTPYQIMAQTNTKVISFQCKKSKAHFWHRVAALNSCSHYIYTQKHTHSLFTLFYTSAKQCIASVRAAPFPLSSWRIHLKQLNSWTHAASRHMEEKLFWRLRRIPTMKTTTETCTSHTHKHIQSTGECGETTRTPQKSRQT